MSRQLSLMAALLVILVLFFTGCSSNTTITTETETQIPINGQRVTILGLAKNEVVIDLVELRSPEMMDPWIDIVVKYNEHTVPYDVYFINLEINIGGISYVVGTEETIWRDIPGEDVFNFGKTLTFKSNTLSSAIANEKLKPISQRGDIKYIITVDKTTPPDSPGYTPALDEVTSGFNNTYLHLGFEAWVKISNASKSGTYTVNFEVTYQVGGTYTESVSKYISKGESAEFRIEQRGKYISGGKYSISYPQ